VAQADEDRPLLLTDPAVTDGVEVTDDPEVLTLPLRARGARLGELTLVRSTGHRFDERDRALAAELVLRAALAVDAARVYEERTTLASTLRDALRPSPLPRLPGVELGARYRPAEEATEIGGDFYDVYRGPDEQWWFVVGDVCGKGVEAAVLTGKVRSALRMAALAGRRPDTVLHLLNEVMLLEGGMSFVTLIVGRISPAGLDDSVSSPAATPAAGLRLDLAGGGHLAPLVLRASGAVEPVNAGGVLVGMLPEASFRVSEVRLAAGEVLVLYTDGVIEADDPSGEQFGPERLAAVLSDSRGMTPQAVTERIEQNVLQHLQGRPHDDIAVFALAPERS
jgi:serine phosphatase RsbU (regulator of sigma subunit)